MSRILHVRKEWLVGLLRTAISYYLLASLALNLTLTSTGITAIWPASAVLLASLLHSARSHWIAYILIAALAEWLALVGKLPAWTLISYLLLHSGEAVMAALLIQHINSDARRPGQHVSTHYQRITKRPTLSIASTFLITCLALPALSGLAAAVVWAQLNPTVSFEHSWQAWWLSVAAGHAASLPLWWQTQTTPAPYPARHYEQPGRLEQGALATSGLLLFLLLSRSDWPPTPYLALLWIIWLALRTTPRITAITIALLALVAVLSHTPAYQVWLIVVSVTGVLLSTSIQQNRFTLFELKMEAERRKINQHTLSNTYEKLDTLNQQLNATAPSRVRDLERINAELQRNLIDLKNEHTRLQKQYSELVAQMAERSLQNAEFSREYVRLSRQVQFYHDEIQVLRQQIDFFVGIVNTSEVSY